MMNIEEVIEHFGARGGRRGVTASPSSPYFERARTLDFQLCRCSAQDARREYPDYIARTQRGAHLYVGLDPRSGIISCGPKGYHWQTGTRPCV